MLWKDDGYAYAQIQQGTDGTIYFARVSNSEALYHAMQEGTLTSEIAEDLRPTVDVLRLMPDSDKPELWITNVSQYSIAPLVSP